MLTYGICKERTVNACHQAMGHAYTLTDASRSWPPVPSEPAVHSSYKWARSSVYRLHAEQDSYLVITVRQANPLRLGHEDGHRLPTAKGWQALVLPLVVPFYESIANTLTTSATNCVPTLVQQ